MCDLWVGLGIRRPNHLEGILRIVTSYSPIKNRESALTTSPTFAPSSLSNRLAKQDHHHHYVGATPFAISSLTGQSFDGKAHPPISPSAHLDRLRISFHQSLQVSAVSRSQSRIPSVPVLVASEEDGKVHRLQRSWPS